MIVDPTGVTLVPGNGGRDCPGNGYQENVECCCDECDYYLCCFDANEDYCKKCHDQSCPRWN